MELWTFSKNLWDLIYPAVEEATRNYLVLLIGLFRYNKIFSNPSAFRVFAGTISCNTTYDDYISLIKYHNFCKVLKHNLKWNILVILVEGHDKQFMGPILWKYLVLEKISTSEQLVTEDFIVNVRKFLTN